MIKCKRCNRTLKHPDSVKRSYGLTCAKKKQGLINDKCLPKTKQKVEYKSLFDF